MSGERGLRCRRPVSGLSAAHIPPLFPRPAARVADALPHQAFPPSCAALEAARSQRGSGGRRGGRPDGGTAAARCALGGLRTAIRMGGYCLPNKPAGWDSQLCGPQGAYWSPNPTYPGSDLISPPCPPWTRSGHTQLSITRSSYPTHLGLGLIACPCKVHPAFSFTLSTWERAWSPSKMQPVWALQANCF